MVIYYMYMSKQMFHTVFVIALTFCAESELQIRIVKFCTAANFTSVSGCIHSGFCIKYSAACTLAVRCCACISSAGLICVSVLVSHTTNIIGKLLSAGIHLPVKITSSFPVLRRIVTEVSCAEEKDEEIHHGSYERYDRYPIINISLKDQSEILSALVHHQSKV